jgi:tetratricopeptide (TPR) repeat protein
MLKPGGAPQMSRLWVRIVLIAASCVTTAVIVRAQHDHQQPALPDSFEEPMRLYSKPNVLGAFTRPISSSNVDAQRYFDQGFQLMYAFDKYDAIRSFREAEKHAPDCAICYWGEAWAWGSFLNGPMGADQAPFAFAAIQRALNLSSDHTTAIERALIDAMSRRYVEHFDPEKRRDQDIPYAEAMRAVHERFPKDLEVGTLYGEALFLLEPRRGSRDINAPNVQRILRALEDVLKIDPKHIGACHLYIHLTEATQEPQRAEKCADSIGNTIPGASHLNHMPSHIWNLLGRWGDSVRANLQAWQSDQKAAVGQGFAIYPSHDLHMLVFAASMDGQGAIAVQAAKDYTKFDTNMYHVLALVRFGRFDDIPELNKRPENNDIGAGAWDFGQGYSRLRTGEKDFARAYLNRILATANTSKAMFRVHNAHDLLGILGAILEGEIDRSDGSFDRAIQDFNRAVAQYDALMYDEPEPFPFSPRHWLGAALLEAKRYVDAERVYREDLKKHPHNGWSLVGLKAALESQGKRFTEVDKDFEASWARSDTWIQASRF